MVIFSTFHSRLHGSSITGYRNKVDSLLSKTFQTLWADATHRCRASIRTLSGPLVGPVQVGVRSRSQVRHGRDGPGTVGAAIYQTISWTVGYYAVTRTRQWMSFLPNSDKAFGPSASNSSSSEGFVGDFGAQR